MIYIASPYSSPIDSEREDRAYQAGAFAAQCANHGHVVYCPIASWHHLAKEHGMPKDFEFWGHLNLNILRHCAEFWVLRLDGWDESVGLTAEMGFAQEVGMTVRHFCGDNFQEII